MSEPEQIKLSDLIPDSNNANRGTERGRYMIEQSLRKLGAGRSILLDKNGRIIAGNKTAETAGEIGLDDVIVVRTTGDKIVAVLREDLDLDADDGKARQLAYADNRAGQVSLDFDPDVIAADLEQGVDLSDWFQDFELDEIMNAEPEPLPAGDAEPQINKADELREKWGVELGQLWRLPSRTSGQEHRLICGDCTDAAVVERVMGGEVAMLCHADPPYGMGKEKDGIANDNLYREKLDAFQMMWWKAQRRFLADNGSAYIWGNAEDLWRLWYVGGLKDSERLTFRNDIIWHQETGVSWGRDGMAGLRQYAKMGERCLFFMLGEQGFNNNADNYWEGWEPIRAYLEAEMRRCGWTVADLNRITGTQMGGHWVTRSQWGLITEDHYKTIQREAREHDAFKREHDELKREFYSTRAYFDNTHDNMTDVWSFPRVTGDDRHGHTTPKPVAMVERAIKSSSPEGAIIYAPFAGTWPEVIAAENLARQCRAVEISPAYVAVALQRYEDAFGITPELVE